MSDNTVRKKVSDLYNEKKKKTITELLQRQPYISFTVDMWSSKWGTDFMGITAYFIDETWTQRELLVGLEHYNVW